MNDRPVIDLPHGITTIDTGYQRPGLAASHLIVDDGEAAFVDVGTGHSANRLLAALESKRIAPEQVRYVIVTHVHLDHAGGAGALMRALPEARLVVHPRGARHMIDPGKLVAGATAVYGEAEMRRLFGAILPVPETRVIEAGDGHALHLGSRELAFLDTPGHARHHFCVHDPKSNGVFTGDTFGLCYRELDGPAGPFIFPTTTPVQFEPEAMHASIDRLMALRPERAYLTHFGIVEGLARLAVDLHHRVDTIVALAERAAGLAEQRHARLIEGLNALLLAELDRAGCPLPPDRATELLAMDVELNAQGLEVWLDRRGGS